MAAVSAWFQVINDLLDPTGQNLRVREDSQVSCCTLILFKILVLLSFHIFLFLPIIMSLLLYFNLFLNTRSLIFPMLLEYKVYVLLHDHWGYSLSEDWSFNLSQSFSFIKIFSFMLKQWVRISLNKIQLWHLWFEEYLENQCRFRSWKHLLFSMFNWGYSIMALACRELMLRV